MKPAPKMARTNTMRNAISVQLAVIGALILRDMKTRAGRSYWGFAFLILVPLGHLAAIVAINEVLGRVAPYGTDTVLYLSLSIIPFVMFVYPSRQIMVSITSNRPLLYFPRVHVLDIVFSRCIVECVSAFVGVFIILASLLLLGITVSPRDPFGVLLSLMATLYYGIAIGFINGLVAYVFPIWLYGYSFLMPVVWLTSGIIFLPSAVPEPYRSILSYNPLLQCVEWLRLSYYEGYQAPDLNLTYFFSLTTFLMVLGFSIEKIGRKIVLSR